MAVFGAKMVGRRQGVSSASRFVDRVPCGDRSVRLGWFGRPRV